MIDVAISIRHIHVSFVFYDHEVKKILNVAAVLFRMKFSSVMEFKEVVGVSDISAAFGCLNL
jgi:hypothetical protein